MKTAFRDIKYYGTTWIHFVLFLLVVVFDMQVTAQSETTIEPVIATTCKPGYSPPPDCNEFNECSQGTSGCEQKCTDTVASFICSCNAGYRLAPDGRSCDDINECNEKSSNCTQNCTNNPGSFTCHCRAGYRLAANERSCDDIDECTDGSSLCMPKNSSYCFNTNGSYTCSCRPGYRLAADGKLCNDVDECGILVDNCDVPENSICKNTLGSYQCVCKTGFEPVGPLAQCRDINECETLTNNCTLYENTTTTCENIIGSYKCRPKDRGTSEATKVAIAVTICLVLAFVLVIIAVVYLVRRAKERKGNEKALTGPAKNNTVTVASAKEHVYVNQAFDSAKGDSKSSRAKVSSEILYEECDDMRNQVTNTNDSQMEFAEIVYEDFSNVPVTKTKPKPLPKPKPKLNDVNTQEQCCSTNVPCSTPGNGKAESKEATGGKTIFTNVHKGIQRIFKFKKANKDLQSGETTNECVYQDLVRVSGVDGVYEEIRKPQKAKKVSVQ